MRSLIVSSLHNHFLVAYLTAISALFTPSVAAVYSFFNYHVNAQFNKELLNLAQAAGPSLEVVKAKGSAGLKPHLSDKVPWHHFIKIEKGIEWYNADGKLLAKHGTIFPKLPLVKYSSPVDLEAYSSVPLHQQQSDRSNRVINNPPQKKVHREQGPPVIQQQGDIRLLTVAVYINDPKKKTLKLEGYIRVSESTVEVERVLNQFLWGLGTGGIIIFIAVSITSVYLFHIALKPIRQSFQRLKQFSAEASHELRNPITAIGTTVELMQSHPEQLNPLVAKKLEIISSATDQITRLVDDLLFLVRIDASVAPAKSEALTICLDKMLNDLVEQFKLQAESRKIDFEAHLVPGIIVKGDPHQLSRLFSNLLENAFKYTGKGGRVDLYLEKNNRFAIVRVKDTGIGIPQEYLPFIFQRFWQSDQAKSQQKDGLGLGLAIAQTIAHRHQGEIQVKSQVGVGSSFEVYLPLG
jgi:two-component system, OmpR family, manganese sensing sensor histidine kinase